MKTKTTGILMCIAGFIGILLYRWLKIDWHYGTILVLIGFVNIKIGQIEEYLYEDLPPELSDD